MTIWYVITNAWEGPTADAGQTDASHCMSKRIPREKCTIYGRSMTEELVISLVLLAGSVVSQTLVAKN